MSVNPPDLKAEIASTLPAAGESVPEGTPIDIFYGSDKPTKKDKKKAAGGGGAGAGAAAGAAGGSEAPVAAAAPFPLMAFDGDDDILVADSKAGKEVDPPVAETDALEKDPTWSPTARRSSTRPTARARPSRVNDRERPPAPLRPADESYADPSFAPTTDATVLAVAQRRQPATTATCASAPVTAASSSRRASRTTASRSASRTGRPTAGRSSSPPRATTASASSATSPAGRSRPRATTGARGSSCCRRPRTAASSTWRSRRTASASPRSRTSTAARRCCTSATADDLELEDAERARAAGVQGAWIDDATGSPRSSSATDCAPVRRRDRAAVGGRADGDDDDHHRGRQPHLRAARAEPTVPLELVLARRDARRRSSAS